MPQLQKIEKAILQECTWTDKGKLDKLGRKVVVQFNPESLKLTTSNQLSGENNKGGAAIQFSSKGSTKLSFSMWFDVNAPQAQSKTKTDVRELTKEIAEFMKVSVKGKGKKAKYIPPGCMFLWGNVLFFGVMESFNETLEYFSEKGVPLRASVTVSMTKQDVQVVCDQGNAANANAKNAGSQPQKKISDGKTMQSVYQDKWQERAREQGVEDPTRVPAGTYLAGDLC